MNSKFKIAILGSGSIGKRQYGLLKSNFNCEILFFKSNKKKLSNDIKSIYNWDEIVEYNPFFILIANPTYLHIPTSLMCAKLGFKIFLEKPIGSNLTNLANLNKVINKKKIVSYVAYNLRFHPIIRKLKRIIYKKKIIHVEINCASHLSKWKNQPTKLKNYSKYKKMGGGVLLDLSHELDYIEYIFGNIKKIFGFNKILSKVTYDSEDYANLNIITENCYVSLNLKYFSHMQERKIKIDFVNFTLMADLINGTITKYSNKKNKKIFIKKTNKNSTYIDQLKYFINNINNFAIMNSIPKASALYEKIINFKSKR